MFFSSNADCKAIFEICLFDRWTSLERAFLHVPLVLL